MAYEDVLSQVLRRQRQQRVAGMTTLGSNELSGLLSDIYAGESDKRFKYETFAEQQRVNKARMDIAQQQVDIAQQQADTAQQSQDLAKQAYKEQQDEKREAKEEAKQEKKKQEYKTVGGVIGTAVGSYYGGTYGGAIGGVVGSYLGGVVYHNPEKSGFKGLDVAIYESIGVATPVEDVGTLGVVDSNLTPTAFTQNVVGNSISVICTELLRQKRVPKHLYYTSHLWSSNNKNVTLSTYKGYRQLADPVVKVMKKSAVFSKFVSIFAIAYMKETAHIVNPNVYGSNWLGKIIIVLGVPICKRLGEKQNACIQ